MKSKAKFTTRNLVLLSLLTAIVVVLQVLALVFPTLPFTLTLVLVPIVIGSALIGPAAGGWLGLVFGFVVLATGGANLFLPINAPATIIIVLLKGALAGILAGCAYALIAGKNRTAATVAAAVVSPVVNTGIFILGVYMFFLPEVARWGMDAGAGSAAEFIFLGMVGINFPVELAINIILSPVIVRLIEYYEDRKAGK